MKYIKLTKGKQAIVDDEDFDELNKYKWCVSMGYAVRRCSVEQRIIRMHRVIIGAKEGEELDHINRNKLDNRKNNLRFTNHFLNSLNTDIQKNNTSGYRGVCWDKKKKKWKSFLNFKGIMYNLGRHKNIEEAIKKRMEGELKYYGFN